MFVAITVGSDNYGDLGKNFVREGLVDRITPFNTQETGKTLDTEKMYDNLMNKFRFGGLENPNIYLDETVMRMCYTHRRIFAQLGLQLMREGKADKALKLMEKVEKVIPAYNVPHGWQGGSLDIARTWMALGKTQKGEEIADAVGQNSCEYIEWFLSQPNPSVGEIQFYFYRLQEVMELLSAADSKLTSKYEKAVERYYAMMARTPYRAD